MVLLFLRAFLICLYLPFRALAAPNRRRAGDGTYGAMESSAGPSYYPQTTLPGSDSSLWTATALSTFQTSPSALPLPSSGSLPQESGSAGDSYIGYGSSSIGKYPLYDSTASYGPEGAGLSGTASSTQATPFPSFNWQASALPYQPCSQNAGYTANASTQTVTTMVTDTQTVTTVVTSTKTVTTVATSTRMVTAYITVTTTSTHWLGTGSPLKSQGGGLALSKANAFPYPTTAGTPDIAAQGMSGDLIPGATYPGTGVPGQTSPALSGNNASLPIFVSNTNGPLQPQMPSTQVYIPSQVGFGSAGQPILSMSVPASQVYGNTSSPSGAGIAIPQVSSQAYANQGAYPSQQQPANSYNVPLTTAPVISPVGVPDYPLQGQVGTPAVSTSINPYQSQNEGPGPEIPSTLPPFMNDTQEVTGRTAQPTGSSLIPLYPVATSLSGSGGINLPGTGSTTTLVSTYHVVPVPATSMTPLPGASTNLPVPIITTSQAIASYSGSNLTTTPGSGSQSIIPVMSTSSGAISSLPIQSIIPAASNTSLLIPPISNITLPPTNAAPIPSTSAVPSLAPIQSTCTPLTTTYTAMNVRLSSPPRNPLPKPPNLNHN